MAGQAGKIQHLCNYYYSPENTALAQELSQASGMAKAFFCNSGAEANECAVKIARKYGEKRGAYKIVTLNNSFHGRTLTTLAATGQEGFHKDFLPLTEGFLYAQAGDLEGIQALLDGSVCAVMLEMVQGEGGVIPMDEGFVQGLAQLCREQDVLLLVDEVQTGIGRTGTFYAYQGYGIQPDVVTTAKGMAGRPAHGRLPGAAKGWGTSCSPGQNGSTFGGNPVACAGARVVVRRVVRPRLPPERDGEGRLLPGEAGGHAPGGVRPGPGPDAGREAQGARTPTRCWCSAPKQGLLILTAKELVRFLPPLTITQEDMDQGLAIFQKVLEPVKQHGVFDRKDGTHETPVEAAGPDRRGDPRHPEPGRPAEVREQSTASSTPT